MKTSKNAHAAHAGLCANIAKATRKAVTTALICVLLAGMLTACGGDSSKSYDLQEVYQEILAAQPENTDDLSGVMFETTDQDAIEEVYPGLGAIKLKQEVCYQHAVTGFCEIMLVEVADSKDVQSVVDIFNQRIDTASNDSFYLKPRSCGHRTRRYRPRAIMWRWSRCRTVTRYRKRFFRSVKSMRAKLRHRFERRGLCGRHLDVGCRRIVAWMLEPALLNQPTLLRVGQFFDGRFSS